MPMCRPIRHEIAAWLGVAALFCQLLLPFGVLQRTGPGWSEEAAHHEHHHHDPGLLNALGPDGAFRHSHLGDTPAPRVRVDLGYLTPFTVLDPPQSLAVALRWVEFVADRMAPAPSGADSFSRPLPRAPPPPA
jgi:hypothetical protein